jgi:hypothetical protein
VAFLGRIPLGHGARFGALTLETGYQALGYTHDSPADIGVPDVGYELIDAGVGWDRALVPRRLEVALRLAYLGFLSAGPLTSTEEYGAANGGGVDLEGGLTAWPARWLWVRLSARYSAVRLSLSGSGLRYARGASDQWGAGSLEVGFAL